MAAKRRRPKPQGPSPRPSPKREERRPDPVKDPLAAIYVKEQSKPAAERPREAARSISAAPPAPTGAPRPLRPDREIPAIYNETYLRVLPRDPYHLFAFWEIAPAALDKAPVADFPEETQRRLLRLYETNGRAVRPLYDIAVDNKESSRYIRVPQPGCSYRIEYGIETRSGGYIPLCAAPTVAVPAARVHEPPAGQPGQADADRLFGFSIRSGTVTPDSVAALGVRPEPMIDDMVTKGIAHGALNGTTRAEGAHGRASTAPCSSRLPQFPPPGTGDPKPNA
jgi:hypothetical protein